MAQEQNQEKNKYKHTLNLPQTDFPIRANAKVDDPALIERWNKEDLFHQSFIHNKGKEKFILHDGPPYANGHIHLGHAYNKILKDIVCKAQRMAGKHVPVTPGWDCHGLPIEIHVAKEFPHLSALALKQQCRDYANSWIDIQRGEFKQLGVLMDWDNPYLTMNHSYEAATLRAFGICVKDGFIEKKKKTVPWCASDQTVLATAEIEYKERKDPSIYVKFPIQQETVKTLLPNLAGKPVSILVWTTTPWTLPLNRAVLLKPETQYQVLEVNGEYIVVGSARVDAVTALADIDKKVITELSSEQLQGIKIKHPFVEGLLVPIILDQSVLLTDGTAAVHCAPGCGPEDYDVALKNNLDIFSPLSADGHYIHGIEPRALEGMAITDGQIWVLKTLVEKNALFFKTSIKHNYPHCWRCHNPLMFRATSQWFLNLSHDNLKKHALEAIDTMITFLPERSINYLRATVDSRLEWCISRQRVWGVPIPALLCSNCEYAYITPELIEKVVAGVQNRGVEYWDEVTLAELGVSSLSCPRCLKSAFVKEHDILDVWFDSGISHFAVLYKNPALHFPADLYLEGIDQHRGWFQSSLLMSLVLEKTPCTKAFLTHGFTVDEKGHKMSKSVGNVKTPAEIIAKIGTDGLRLWVSSINYEGDAVVSESLMQNVAEVYRKIRNTCRFLLSNLYDFDHEKDLIPLEKMLLIDRYALEQLFHINVNVRASYAKADFTAVFHAFADYCTTELSSFYLDIIKDRLYVEKADGLPRRSAQTACWYILDTLTKLMAPILSFTAEQISDHYQRTKPQSIHLQAFNDLDDVWNILAQETEKVEPSIDWYPFKAHAQETAEKIRDLSLYVEREEQWQLLRGIRSALLKAIELRREQGLIKHSLETRVKLYFDLSDEFMTILNDFFAELMEAGQTPEQFLKEFLIVSQIEIVTTKQGLTQSELKGLWVHVDHAAGDKCPRCWQWDITNHPDKLCNRCQAVLGQ